MKASDKEHEIAVPMPASLAAVTHPLLEEPKQPEKPTKPDVTTLKLLHTLVCSEVCAEVQAMIIVLTVKKRNVHA